ncbi:DOMON-like domain-containing protein [Dechloromonas sp. ZY10]|uniref:DOMON-like domain-containing protein n=1 Tax=Dechloromonas aquae TaxID=2664436 RepID=UPI003527722B
MPHPVHRVLHPFAAADGGGIEVTLQATADTWQIDYRIAAPGLKLPATVAAQRCDGLWLHTCCELFIATVDCPNYREFNFSPSGAWAVYDFADYRQRLADPAVAIAPTLNWHSDATEHHLQVTLPGELLPPGPWQISISAVLENQAGELAYWALHHPGERPDFHRRDAFTLLMDPHQP